MSIINDVELSIDEAPGMPNGLTRVAINGVEIRKVVSIDVSAAHDALTEVTLKFFARINQPKGTGEGE